jgi:hypothetical protein
MTRRTDQYTFREIRTNVRWKHIKPVFISYGNGVVVKNGHVSLYAIDEEMARRIMLSGSVRKWRPIHYSSVVWIDLDSRDGINELVDRLCELDWYFSVFDSGNKGYHICFKRDAMPSNLLAYKDKLLVSEYFRDLKCYSDFDLGIYHALHLFRAVGCTHEKTRIKKHHICTRRGNVIPCSDHYEVSILSQDVAARCDVTHEYSEWEKLRNVLFFHNGPGANGSRYQTMWKLGKDLCKAGLSSNQISVLMELYNASFGNPHCAEEVARAVKDSVRAVRGTQ